MVHNDWLPASRDGKRQMCMNWLNHATEHKERLEIPQAQIDKLGEVYSAFMTDYMMPSEMRTPFMIGTLKKKEEELIEEMRVFKKRFLTQPPLENRDFNALGLKIPDSEPTSVSDPIGQAEAKITYPASTQLQLHLQHVEGTPYDAKANYGYRIYYDVFGHEDTLPTLGKELRKSKFTRQKKITFTFDEIDRTKKAYFIVKYENSKGKDGPWGPMVWAVIP